MAVSYDPIAYKPDFRWIGDLGREVGNMLKEIPAAVEMDKAMKENRLRKEDMWEAKNRFTQSIISDDNLVDRMANKFGWSGEIEENRARLSQILDGFYDGMDPSMRKTANIDDYVVEIGKSTNNLIKTVGADMDAGLFDFIAQRADKGIIDGEGFKLYQDAKYDRERKSLLDRMSRTKQVEKEFTVPLTGQPGEEQTFKLTMDDFEYGDDQYATDLDAFMRFGGQANIASEARGSANKKRLESIRKSLPEVVTRLTPDAITGGTYNDETRNYVMHALSKSTGISVEEIKKTWDEGDWDQSASEIAAIKASNELKKAGDDKVARAKAEEKYEATITVENMLKDIEIDNNRIGKIDEQLAAPKSNLEKSDIEALRKERDDLVKHKESVRRAYNKVVQGRAGDVTDAKNAELVEMADIGFRHSFNNRDAIKKMFNLDDKYRPRTTQNGQLNLADINTPEAKALRAQLPPGMEMGIFRDYDKDGKPVYKFGIMYYNKYLGGIGDKGMDQFKENIKKIEFPEMEIVGKAPQTQSAPTVNASEFRGSSPLGDGTESIIFGAGQ
jgi:hypothetical protein